MTTTEKFGPASIAYQMRHNCIYALPVEYVKLFREDNVLCFSLNNKGWYRCDTGESLTGEATCYATAEECRSNIKIVEATP